jgi:hypothetical protein
LLFVSNRTQRSGVLHYSDSETPISVHCAEYPADQYGSVCECHAVGASPIILIVEDDVLIRAAAAQHLRGCGMVVLEAVDVEQALDLLRAERSVQVVFADVKLPGSQDGLDLMRIVQRDHPDIKMLLPVAFSRPTRPPSTG